MRGRTANKMPYLVNALLVLCKAKVLHTRVFDASRKVVAKERANEDVLERRAVYIAGA